MKEYRFGKLSAKRAMHSSNHSDDPYDSSAHSPQHRKTSMTQTQSSWMGQPSMSPPASSLPLSRFLNLSTL